RNPPNSRFSASSAPSIRRFSSLIRASGIFLFLVRYDRVASTCLHNFREAAWLGNTEYQDRDVVLTRERDGSVFHHPKIVCQHIKVVEALEALGVRDLDRVGVINAIHLGSLEQRVHLHL